MRPAGLSLCLTILLVALAVPARAAAVHPGVAFTIKEYPVPTAASYPYGATLGPDGNVWFTEYYGSGAGNIGKITTSGVVTEYPVNLTGTWTGPLGITAGPDGALWFVEKAAGRIGRITTSGVVTEYPIPLVKGEVVAPLDIAAGADGRLWFTEANEARIGRITTSGTFLKAIPTVGGGAPLEIAAGPDGDLWYTEEASGNQVFKLSTDGSTNVAVPLPAGAAPGDVNPGPDGNMWFTDGDNNAVGWVTTDGSANGEWALPTASANPTGIAAGPDGNVWFTEPAPAANNIGEIAPAGPPISEAPIPTSGASSFHGITPGADGNMWFTESEGDNIGVTQPPGPFRPTIEWCCNRVFIPNESSLPTQGETVSWMTLSPLEHGVTDTTGLRLYGFSPSGGPTTIPIGESMSFQFDWAGTYSYDDPFHASSKGRVTVPIEVQPLVGAPGAQVMWASGDAPSGDAFDVQVRRPGSHAFLPWRTGVTELSDAFTSSDPMWTGPGKYAFRARLRQVSSGATSGYSAAASIRLT
jgi:streptogramin lyase